VDTPRFGIAGGPNDGVLIEEAHTNLLTADVSQALTTESPYTTGTLDGTYTFSCMTGSYELSGGATGTVTPTTPQTKTITSATVTLTGTATFNQCTKTGYPLSWTLGGTTMAAETLTVNSSVYDLTSGTIELEALANDIIKTDGINNYLLSTADGDGNNQISLLDDSSNNLTITTKASDAATSVSYADSNLTSNTMFKVAAPYKSDKLKLFKDGSSVGTPLTSANLPTTKQTIYLGSKYDGTLQANTLIRNVVISTIKRTDEDVTARAESELPVADEHCTMIYPLTKDLSAYRGVER
jgi:hypothetical protein